MYRSHVRLFVVAIASTLLAVGCKPPSGSESTPSASNAAASALHTKADTKQLMNWILDFNADKVWAVGGTITTKEGEQKFVPKTEEEWNAVRNAAATVAEASNLLLVPPHSRNNGDWIAMTHKLIDEANKCVEAAEAKDVDALFTSAGDMYEACTACHAKYVIGQTDKNTSSK